MARKAHFIVFNHSRPNCLLRQISSVTSAGNRREEAAVCVRSQQRVPSARVNLKDSSPLETVNHMTCTCVSLHTIIRTAELVCSYLFVFRLKGQGVCVLVGGLGVAMDRKHTPIPQHP